MLDNPHPTSLAVSIHRLLLVRLFLVILTVTSIPANAKEVTPLPPLEGVWFTCEFATRQGPPDDGCIMFDDEGFAVEDGNITYLRNIASEETACRGNKAGNYCFPILAAPKYLTCSLRQIMSVLSRQKINVSGRAIAIFMSPPIKES